MRYLLPMLALLAGCQVNVTPGPTPTASPTAAPTASPSATPSPTPSPTPSFPLGQSFNIKVDQTLANGDLRLSFSAVTEDSRCPQDVVCVWAGQAKARLRFSQGSQAEDILLTLPAPETPVTSANGSYRFIAEALNPYPKASDPTPAKAYVLTLRVEKVN